MLKRLQQNIDKLTNQHRFISAIISRKLEIFNVRKDDIIQKLRDDKYLTYGQIYPENRSEANEESKKVDETKDKIYGYLLGMNILTFSAEKMENLSREMNEVHS